MKYIQVENGLSIKSWCEVPEEGAVKQAENLARLPFAFHHIALMPDTHQGYGMPIGGVLATENIVIPNAVGVDIGCGMCVAKTNLTSITAKEIKRVFGGSKEYKGGIRSAVPVGFNKHHKEQDESLMPPYGDLSLYPIVEREWNNALHSLGTLGGGNHFIEIQKSNTGLIYVMIHSGSRNLGKQVSDHYNKLAGELNAKYFSSVPAKWDLAFLPVEDKLGQQYITEMMYCVEYARANRMLMMERIMVVFDAAFGPDFQFGDCLDVAHNYARLENHFDHNVMVHRKGATSARAGELGIIPGSQGASSYIVRGKGNEDSFTSCSHGAGRKMGRNQAERTLSLVEEKKRLDDKGVIHAIRGVKDLDEAPGSYKDIDVVMAEQADLIDVVVKLEPLGVIKG